MKKVVGLAIGLMPVLVSAQCITPPDCASIGYTETSCEGDSIKCPFDTSKLYCPPCDSSFRYTCTGDNIKKSIGAACNNKYVSCECEDRTIFVNGECVCDTSCDTIGNIYYSDGTCSSCNLTDKTPVGIIAYKDETKHFVISLDNNTKSTGTADQINDEGKTSIGRNTDLSGLYNYGNKDSALTDSHASGAEQTSVIATAYGENATGVAAVYCYNYAPTGLESTKGQWFLPATGELYNVVFTNKVNINKGFSILGKNSLNGGYHWSSSEGSSLGIWCVSNDGTVGQSGKSMNNNVTCLLSL